MRRGAESSFGDTTCLDAEVGAALVDRALAINPGDAGGAGWRAWISMMPGDHERAIEEAARSLRPARGGRTRQRRGCRRRRALFPKPGRGGLAGRLAGAPAVAGLGGMAASRSRDPGKGQPPLRCGRHDGQPAVAGAVARLSSISRMRLVRHAEDRARRAGGMRRAGLPA